MSHCLMLSGSICFVGGGAGSGEGEGEVEKHPVPDLKALEKPKLCRVNQCLNISTANS